MIRKAINWGKGIQNQCGMGHTSLVKSWKKGPMNQQTMTEHLSGSLAMGCTQKSTMLRSYYISNLYISVYLCILINPMTTFSTTSSLSCHRIMQIRNITFLETSENITLSYGGGIKWMETPFSRCCGKKMLYQKE